MQLKAHREARAQFFLSGSDQNDVVLRVDPVFKKKKTIEAEFFLKKKIYSRLLGWKQ